MSIPVRAREYLSSIEWNIIENIYDTEKIPTEGEEYSSEELKTVAEDILGQKESTTFIGTTGVKIPCSFEIYQEEEGELHVYSDRSKAHQAVEKAAEMLEKGEVQVIKYEL